MLYIYTHNSCTLLKYNLYTYKSDTIKFTLKYAFVVKMTMCVRINFKC